MPGPALAVNQVTISNPGCNGSTTGSIRVKVAGGTAPFKFKWATNPTAADDADGDYTITDLVTGVYPITITDANAVMVTINPFPKILFVTVTVEPVTGVLLTRILLLDKSVTEKRY